VAVTVKVLEKQLERYPEFRNWEAVMDLLGRKKPTEAPVPAAQAVRGTLF